MTSRTPMGVPPRQPQRTTSSSSLSTQQRIASQQRMLSQQQQQQQQHLSASPARRDSFGDLPESGDGTQNRPGINTPKRGGSRLRLQLSNDLDLGSQAVESPQSLASAHALLTGDGFDGANSPALSRVSQHDNDNPPMPMPKRKRFISRPVAPKLESVPAPVAAKKDGRPKPYAIEVPSDAPRLVTNNRNDPSPADFFGKGLFSGRADFFPWTGKHLEDEWSSESAAKGIWEKYTSAESSSARMAIAPPLKQKQGLHALSTIFMGVLNQRRTRGHISAPSSFKPPPRVTLTDTKREVWLKDLANPTTSLRRLSRTIPHGIRGRALLDQCLKKNVPIERAVWLAKCVGANEIRAFKRKGVNGAFIMGGEMKWCKDWTVFVEQFVEAMVTAPSETDWKAKVTYAIRLATNLYSEYLLDRDHYLDWVMSNLEGSTHARLPLWTLISRIYWADLLRARKYGRRLVSALLKHMHAIHNDLDRDILLPLATQLSTLLAGVVKSNPESFIYPSTWMKYRDTLKAVLPGDDGASQRAYQSISDSNMRLAASGSSYPLAGRQRLTRLLDLTLQNSFDQDLATKCWAASDDKSQLVGTLIEWAASAHRPGLAKVYTATRLLQSFKAWAEKPGFDATTPALNMLDKVAQDDQEHKQLLFHLVAELTRERLFSVPQYLRWLIARGGIQDPSEIAADAGLCATRLLIELPLESLGTKLRTERANLLRRAGDYSVADEEADSNNAVAVVRYSLGFAPTDNDSVSVALSQRKPIPLRKIVARIRSSSKALKCTVSSHLREVMVQQGLSGSSYPAAASMFASVRSILEATQDYRVLSDIIKSCLKASDADVIAACADTINANLSIFLALGSAEESFSVLIERLRQIGQQSTVPRLLLASISHLAQRMPGRKETADQLRQELLQSDRSNAIDACSPVSDNMVAQTSNGDGELSEEIDKLLASGNRIDHPTMNRLFRAILPRLEAGWNKADDSLRVYAASLAKMRGFDMHHFDKLMGDWISYVRTLASRSRMVNLLPLLVISGCLGVPTLLHTANATPPMTNLPANADPATGSSATYLQELLQLLLTKLPKSTTLTPEESYRFAIHQEAAKTENVAALLTLIHHTLVEYSVVKGQNTDVTLPMDDEAFSNSVLEALRGLVVVDSSAASEVLNVKNLPQEAVALVSRITARLLVPGQKNKTDISFDQILGLATELTLPFCQLKLEFDLSRSEANPTASDDPVPSRFDLFANAMDRAIKANNITWTSMLPCLSSDISQHLKDLAHSRFIALVPSLKAPEFGNAISNEQVTLAENLLGVIEAISTGQLTSKGSQLTQPTMDKLVDLVEIVASKDEEVSAVKEVVLDHWLPAMLRLITIHAAATETTMHPPQSAAAAKAPSASHEARARLIIALCSLLLQLNHQSTANLSQHVFSVALQLVDSLPDDLRCQAARAVLLLPGSSPSANLSSDPRLYYILSTPRPTPADNFVLAHREKGAVMQSGGTKLMGAMYGLGPPIQEKLTPFVMRRWEMLSESTPIVGENDTSLSLGLFEAIKIQ